ncbi:hypothetical protein CR513_12801, partial [Mucuna pruriens]
MLLAQIDKVPKEFALGIFMNDLNVLGMRVRGLDDQQFLEIPQSIWVLIEAKIHDPTVFKMETIPLRLAMQQIHNLGIRGHNTYVTKSMSGGDKKGVVFNMANNLGCSTSVLKGKLRVLILGEDDNEGDEVEFDEVELVE